MCPFYTYACQCCFPAKFRWVHDGVFVDRDGSLSGEVGNKILPWIDTLDPDHCVKDDRFSAGAVEGAVCDSTTSFARMSFNKYDIIPLFVWKMNKGLMK